MTDDVFLKCVALERAYSDEESDDEYDETDLVGIEELLSPFHWRNELWRDLSAKRVVTMRRAQGD